MGFLHPTRDIDLRKSRLSKAPFLAEVVDNDDTNHPDGKKRQRTQLRSAVLHRNTEDEHLPWAMPRGGGGAGANAGGGVGTVDVPPIGAKVWAHYDEEDPHIIHYEHSPTTDDVSKDHEALKEDYPHTSSTVDSYGNKTAVNRKQGTITDTAKSGATIFRDKSGNGMLWFPGNFSVGCGGNMTFASKGNITAHGKGTMSLKGSKMMLNCSDQLVSPTEVGARETPKTRAVGGDTKE